MKASKLRAGGFTVVELVTVIVLIGVVSVAAIPRFFDKNVFAARGFLDQVTASLRYAQKVAIAQRRIVCVTFPLTGRLMLRTAKNFTDTTCNTDITSPTGDYAPGTTSYSIDAPSGVQLTGTAFTFDALGGTVSAISISVGGVQVTVEKGTGYVH